MRKLILGLAALAAIGTATLGAAGAADAATQAGTATFTMTEPAGAFDQFGNVWTHVEQVTVNADGSFSGTGQISGDDGTNSMTNYPESVHGQINGDGTISLTTDGRADGASWSLTNAVADGITENAGTVPSYPGYNLKVRVTPLAYDAVVPTPALANHGDCVSSATHAGVKGKDLAAIAKVVTKTGAYGISADCPAV